MNQPEPWEAHDAGGEQGPGSSRALETLERLLLLPASDLVSALTHASNLVARALAADKVDAFLYDDTRESLVAVGSSTQPLSDRQRRLGLDVLPLANGGRVVQVYKTGETFVSGHLEDDAEELRGIKESLKIRSQIGVPLEVGGQRRGMMMIGALAPEHFDQDDVRFAESVVRWVAVVAHRAELVEAMTRAAAAQGRRSAAEELVTILAHDLRNLLSPIDARLNLLQTRAVRDDRKIDIRDAEAGLRTLRRLGKMIGNILDIARIEQGIFELSTQPVDLGEMAKDVARLLATPDRAIEVAASPDTIVAADPERLRQCLENLVANAVQHSPAGAPVTLVLRTVTHEGAEWARLEVRDEGPGVPPDELPHIFERFVSNRRSAGLGLGLYLARRIANAHGGELTVESTPGQGARFTLALPCLVEQ